MNKGREQKRIVEEVRTNGLSFSSVYDLLQEDEFVLYQNVQKFFKDFMTCPTIANRIRRASEGNPILDRKKWYEITCYEYLGRALTLTDGSVINLYLCDTLINTAKLFYEGLPKARNILTWIHPHHPFRQKIRSQKWHRDQEDYQTFKVFIYFNDISDKNGAMEYIMETQHGGKHYNIMDDKPGIGGDFSKFTSEPPSQNIARLSGKEGTMAFVNTNGIHRGGNVETGERIMTQCNYLKPTAPHILNKKLGTFNYDNKINHVDYDSEEFKALSDNQKYLLQ